MSAQTVIMWEVKGKEGRNEQLLDLHINPPVMFAASVVFCFVLFSSVDQLHLSG